MLSERLKQLGLEEIIAKQQTEINYQIEMAKEITSASLCLSGRALAGDHRRRHYGKTLRQVIKDGGIPEAKLSMSL